MKAELYSVLLREVERAQLSDENPGSSPLWLRAPERLRQQYADGRIDGYEFWRALRRWLEFDRAGAAR